MFDPETGAFAANMAMRKLDESGQVGYSEIGKVLTYDGNIEGKETAVYEGLTFVKISDTVYDVTDVQSLKFVQADGSVFEAGKELFIIGALGNIKAIMASESLILVSFVPDGNQLFPAGTWVLAGASTDDGFVPVHVSEVRLDINHPIDEKYLPEASRPLVLKLPGSGSLYNSIHSGTTDTFTYNGSSVEDFWFSINSDRELRFTISYNEERFYVTGGVTRYFENGVCNMVSFIIANSVGSIYQVVYKVSGSTATVTSKPL